MRHVVEVAVRAGAVVALWLSWPDAGSPATGPSSGGWGLFVVVALVGFLWGLVDGLLARDTLTVPLLRWACTAPVAAVLMPLVGGVTESGWPADIDTLRWVVVLTLMFYFLLVLPAGLGVATGSSVQGLRRWTPRG